MNEKSARPTMNSLVAGLAASALAVLQQGHQPADHEAEKSAAADLDGARHVIDLLILLQEKTAGNLTDDEQQFLERTVTDLKFAYVRATQGSGGATA